MLRAKELRGDQKAMTMLRGPTDEAKLEELRTTFGADLLIVGEGVAERNDAQAAELGSVFSRARVEMRAIGRTQTRSWPPTDRALPVAT